MSRPNILFLMTDQQRFDSIAALGNSRIYTPSVDRLVRRGVTFTRAYSTCPVCLPARYTIHTGCEPPTTGWYTNSKFAITREQGATMEARCGPYLPRALGGVGYRTFGIGKFHTEPWNEDLGYEFHSHSEELYGSPGQRAADGFAGFIRREHPEFDFVEQLQGERTEMYYMPQTSPLPAELTVESWAADRAIEQIGEGDRRPWFGFVSFIGPHPPFAPPIPFNRMYDPDRMPSPVRGEVAIDHMDEQITWMNWCIWAEDISDAQARVLKARYYGEISYIDHCIGRILDAVDARPDADNTLVAFFSDHGDMLGDHHAWQKECFFEAACRVPFVLSWPARLPKDATCGELVCLTDLFGIATSAAGGPEAREGVDVLGLLDGKTRPRDMLFGYYGAPGTPLFKVMAREKDWKYIFMANGGREQLFNVAEDADEVRERAGQRRDVAERLRAAAVAALKNSAARAALDGGRLRSFPFTERPRRRILQFSEDRGVDGFPQNPADVLKWLKPWKR